MFKNLIIFIVLFILSVSTVLCTTNGEDNNEINSLYSMQKSMSKNCQKIVNEYDGEISNLMKGTLVVTGNEPFTKLVFKTEKDKEGNQEIYRIKEECSKELWDYQGIEIFLQGKIEIKYLESITGQKMKLMTLYPTVVYGKIWGF
jgi:hypothetical protein